ncbi:putative RDD family membrane protein YckC [Lewinella aquimaris]|uniref:Putative RDD family membrane protein YckC n=1 Tax=Neolewinella aquimaris TaxID=1835722 RepID=A0A840DZR6_9BACT|nr:RDD family protein [Neolewinella aquimaris]MBB4078764.1 putative RDD family membrane protein YckC [Neolewinella aquimaris]
MATVTIHTTHNVRIDYETATVGLRIGAFLIDLVIVAVVYLSAVYALELLRFDLNYVVALRLAPLFWLLGYFFFWEMVSRGQTPGKLLLRLRVIRLDGRDPTPADFLVRTVFLLPDAIFTFGMAAILFIVTGRYGQRLGDLVAHTVVINVRATGGVSLADILTIRDRSEHQARFVAVQRMTDEDMLVVKQCLLRYRRYPNEAHRGALSLLANRMTELLELRREEVPASKEKFLQTLLLDYIVLTR